MSHQTEEAACAPFTPNNSGQRLPPTYYRGCWNVVSRGFLVRYRQGTNVLDYHLFFPNNRVLLSEDIHHSRGIAPSDFRPFRNFPYCSLPSESVLSLSPDLAEHHYMASTLP